MDRMILPILGALFLLCMGTGGMWAWDHHPPVSYKVLFWHVGLPASLAQQRDEAVAQLAALKAQPDKKATTAAHAHADALRLAEAYRKTAKQVHDYQPKGDTACERVQDVDAMILKDLAE